MSRVLVQLVGETLDIEELKYGLRTSPWKIIEETGRYYLTSPLLDSINDTKEAASKANDFLDLLNGSANIFHDNHKNVTIGSLVTIEEDGKRHVTMFAASGEFRMRGRGTLRAAGDNLESTPTTVEEWIDKATRNESVRDAIHFFNNKTWWGLYKVFEVVKEEEGGEDNLYNFVPKHEIRCFRQTAQSREAIGDEARHGIKIPAPQNPMTLKEAHRFIKTLFEKWVRTK